MYVTEVEFNNAWKVALYYELVSRIMGKGFQLDLERLEPEKSFDDPNQSYKITLARPLLKSVHKNVLERAERANSSDDVKGISQEIRDLLGIQYGAKESGGRRVYAVQDINYKQNQVNLFGFGEYVGDEVPDRDAGGLAAHVGNDPNPKIVLDSGEVVWGCECWWGAEEEFLDKFGQFEVVPVSISNFRLLSKGGMN